VLLLLLKAPWWGCKDHQPSARSPRPAARKPSSLLLLLLLLLLVPTPLLQELLWS